MADQRKKRPNHSKKGVKTNPEKSTQNVLTRIIIYKLKKYIR